MYRCVFEVRTNHAHNELASSITLIEVILLAASKTIMLSVVDALAGEIGGNFVRFFEISDFG